jgi:indolepyruvate ferredoxin oxidoreductase
VRRTERALPGEYRALVREALGHLEPRTAAQVTEIAALADLVRGYEEIKMRGVAAMRERGAALLAALAAPPASSLVVRRAVPAGAAPPAQDAMER